MIVNNWLNFVFFLAVLESVVCLYSPNDNIVLDLTKENFASKVVGDPNLWLIEFYAPWCGHCQSLAPEWKKVSAKLKGLIKVAAVNVDEQKDIAAAFQIQGLPTIKLFPSELQQRQGGKQGEFTKRPLEYQGPRSANAIANWAVSQLPNLVKQVNSQNLEEFLQLDYPVKVILFTDKSEASPLYKAIATQFRYRGAFGLASSSDNELAAHFGVTTFPILFTVSTDGLLFYDGPLKSEEISSWLEPLLPVPQRPPIPEPPKQAREQPIERKPEVVELVDQKTLESKCPRGLCMLFFLDPLADPEEHTNEIFFVHSRF
eukprot:TRINITY_DN3143_c0_g2_i2.p1 TRINITY_DN3143_c0_g2~~TRINITY_DN3143_c0_g2_i2.p1  ORF type:complete len:316 (-),score=63.68 TRINITY_DN3143_c0_g2_i2:592-1539(-)